VTGRPAIRLSSTRLPHCPYYYQQEVIRGLEDEGGDYAMMGKIGHKINGLYIDELSSRNPKNYTDFGYFNYLKLKRVPAAFPIWLANDLDTVLDNFMWMFRLDFKAEQHITEVTLAHTRDGQPCDPEEEVDRITFQPDYVRTYHDGAKAAIDDWKLGYQMFDYQSVVWPQDPDMQPSKVCLQLGIYANGWFKLHPECEEVIATVFGPRWGKGNTSSYTWRREDAADRIDPYIAGQFNRAEYYYSEFGDKDWPAEADWRACQWCGYACPNPFIVTLADNVEADVAMAKKQAAWDKALQKILTELKPEKREKLQRLLTGEAASFEIAEVKCG